MPYTKKNAPDAVKKLPAHAMEIWIAAYNSAFEQYDGDEGKSVATAWAAVGSEYEKNDSGEWVAIKAAGPSFDEIRNLLCKALRTAWPGREGWIQDIYEDRCIVSTDSGQGRPGGLYEIPYTVADMAVAVGEPVLVERKVDYVRIEAAARIIAAAGEGGDPGWKWRVQINEAGVDLQGSVDYSLEVLHAAAPLYEGARVFALSQGQHADDHNPYGKSVRDLVGWISDVSANVKGLEGTFNILKSAKWLRDAAVDAWDRGKKDLFGLSHDILGKIKAGSGSGPKAVEKIVKVDSVDVVYNPIAGGKFLRMAAAGKAGRKEADMLERLLAALKVQRPDLYATIEGKITSKAVTEDEVVGLLLQGQAVGDIDRRIAAAVKTALGDPGQINASAQQILDQARIVACGITLNAELTDSKLPEEGQVRIREQYEGKPFETEALRASIKKEKEYIDKLTGSGMVTGSGQIIRVGSGEPERIQAAMDKLFGVTGIDDKLKDVEAFKSIRAAYTQITGDAEVRGTPNRDGIMLGETFMAFMRLPAAYASNTFSYVLGNTLYRRMIQDYRAPGFGEDALISYKRNAKDFRTMESVRIGYFGDLPDVSPENENYQELNNVTDEEIAYAINTKGGLITFSRKYIINDDMRSVQVLISRIGRTGKRTYAQRGWNKIIDNATYDGDAKALFHSDHGNLGAVALSADATGVTTLANRLIAMFNQSELDSGKTLGLEAKWLWCHRNYLETAKTLNSPWPGAATPNPHAGRFGANHERIIPLKLTSDANDWGLIADPMDVELMEVAFLNGQEEPELFLANNPLVGQMFLSDDIVYKIRHEYEWEIGDYRGFDKSVVAG